MRPGFLNVIGHELDTVDRFLDKEMQTKTWDISSLVPLELCWMDKYLLPAALVLTSRAFGYSGPQAVPLACAVQFINLAFLINRRIGDEPGLPVLISDYFHAKFFRFLCRFESLDYLAPLARTICRINEGGALRQELGTSNSPVEVGAWHQVATQEKGFLTAEACRIGVNLNQMTGWQAGQAWRAGMKMGIAWSLQLMDFIPAELVRQEVDEARQLTEFWPRGRYRQALQEILLFFEHEVTGTSAGQGLVARK